MHFKNRIAMTIIAVGGLLLLNGCTVEKTPDVVTTPGSSTVIHDTPTTPNVVVTPPAGGSTHTDTHTNTTTPDQGTASTSTTTTTGN